MKLYAFSIGFDQLTAESAVQMFESITNNKIKEVVNYLSEMKDNNENSDTTGFSIYAVNVNIGYIWFSLKEKPNSDNDMLFRVVSDPKTTTVKFIEAGFVDIQV